VCKSLKQSELR